MTKPSFIISSSQAQQTLTKSHTTKTLQDLLPSLVPEAQQLARPPISKFHVGAVGLSSDGRVFFGANVEFPGLPLHHSIHAEQFLITNMFLHGVKMVCMAVSAAPCGHCRQFLQELRGVGEIMIMVTDDLHVGEGYRPIKEILPYPFGPFDLLDQDLPLVLEEHNNNLNFKENDGNNGNLSNGCLESAKTDDGLVKSEVLEVARGAHAPGNTENYGNLSNGYLESAKTNDGLVKSEVLEVALGAHAPGNIEKYGNLSNGCLESAKTNDGLVKSEVLEAARGAHAPGNTEKFGNLSNGCLESSKTNDGLVKSEVLEVARGAHAPGNTENFGNLSNGYLELAKKNEGLLKSEALAAARGSHAPYSGCPSGVALMDCDGNVYKGMYMESAAFNPSMMPVQAALVAYMVGGGSGYDRIVAAVLVEKEGVMVSQEETARLLLKHISPKCELRVFHCV